jgi:hypothetical protein
MFNDINEESRKAFVRELSGVATQDDQRKRAIGALGERWILHPANAPVKGSYNPLTGKRLG